ncbi:hypothetical protein D3C81_2018130 [compost metagenome]
MVAQGAEGDELDGGELGIAGVLLEDRRMALVGLAQQVADLLGDVVGGFVRVRGGAGRQVGFCRHDPGFGQWVWLYWPGRQAAKLGQYNQA